MIRARTVGHLLTMAAVLAAVCLLYAALYRSLVLDPELARAVDRNEIDAVRSLLVRGARFREAQKGPALLLAATHGDPALVEKLLGLGADPNATDRSGRTPLIWAAARGHTELLTHLLDRGADPNARDRSGEAALLWAMRSNPEGARLLLERGADPNSRGKHGYTALFWAAAQGDLEMARLLLQRGANPNIRSEERGTALMAAAGAGHPEMIRLLLARGASASVQDLRGRSALELARSSGSRRAVEILARPTEESPPAQGGGWHPVITVLLTVSE